MTLAVLLAAGKGRRLGAPKAHLALGGATALTLCLAALREGGVDEVRVVLGPDDPWAHAATDPPRRPPGLGAARVVVNPDPARGQTSSLKCALAGGLGAHAVLVLHTVDHPLVEGRDVAELLAAFARRPAGTGLVVPSVGGRRGHPLLCAPAIVAELCALGDDEPAHRVVRRDPGRVHHVVMDRPWLVRDVDTPADLAAARAALAARGRHGDA